MPKSPKRNYQTTKNSKLDLLFMKMNVKNRIQTFTNSKLDNIKGKRKYNGNKIYGSFDSLFG